MCDMNFVVTFDKFRQNMERRLTVKDILL